MCVPNTLVQPIPVTPGFSTSSSSPQNSPSPVVISSASSACDSQTATSRAEAVRIVMDFLNNTHPTDNNDNSRNIHQDLTEQLITQTRHNNCLSLSELKFYIFNYKITVNVFDTEKQQHDHFKHMSSKSGVDIKEEKINEPIYSSNRRQTIIKEYGIPDNIPDNSEKITPNEFTELNSMFKLNTPQKNNRYDNLFLKYLNSITLATDPVPVQHINAPHIHNNDSSPVSTRFPKYKSYQQRVNKLADSDGNSRREKSPVNKENRTKNNSEINKNNNPNINEIELKTIAENNEHPLCAFKENTTPNNSQFENISQDVSTSINHVSPPPISVSINNTPPPSNEGLSNNEQNSQPFNGALATVAPPVNQDDISVSSSPNITTDDNITSDETIVSNDPSDGPFSENINENTPSPVEEFKNISATISQSIKKESDTDIKREAIFEWDSFKSATKDCIQEKSNTSKKELFTSNLATYLVIQHMYVQDKSFNKESILSYFERNNHYKNNSVELEMEEHQQKFFMHLKENFNIEDALIEQGNNRSKPDDGNTNKPIIQPPETDNSSFDDATLRVVKKSEKRRDSIATENSEGTIDSNECNQLPADNSSIGNSEASRTEITQKNEQSKAADLYLNQVLECVNTLHSELHKKLIVSDKNQKTAINTFQQSLINPQYIGNTYEYYSAKENINIKFTPKGDYLNTLNKNLRDCIENATNMWMAINKYPAEIINITGPIEDNLYNSRIANIHTTIEKRINNIKSNGQNIINELNSKIAKVQDELNTHYQEITIQDINAIKENFKNELIPLTRIEDAASIILDIKNSFERISFTVVMPSAEVNTQLSENVNISDSVDNNDPDLFDTTNWDEPQEQVPKLTPQKLATRRKEP